MSSPVAANTHPDSSRKRPLKGADWDDIRRRLISSDKKDALEAATKLQDCVESLRSKPRELPISTLLPAISTVLLINTNPSPDIFSKENMLRNICMEVLSRLPHDEEFKNHAPTLVDISMQVLVKDFEDNALLASRIIFDMHKNYRPMPQGQVQPYLDFVHTAYRSLPASVQQNFSFDVPKQSTQDIGSPQAETPVKAPSVNIPTGAGVGTPADTTKTPPRDDFLKSIAEVSQPGASPSTGSTGSSSTFKPRVALKSTSSFRVLTECPLTVMLLFQLYPKFKTNIPTLIQLMIEALAIRAPPIQSLVTKGVKSSSSKIESSLKRSYYTRSRELVAAQVKTLSFLTYLLRGFSDQMKPYEDRIASNVVSLMKDCPRESIGTRKELLVATRHILATDFRKGFFRYIDSLLDERILIGSHNHHFDQLTTLQPLGYSTLADLVQQVRSRLSLKQLSRVVYIFSRVIHDSSMTLPLTIQITAVRLLLNLVDIIYHNKDPNPQIGRDLLDRIFDTLVDKLGTLREKVTKAKTLELDGDNSQKKESGNSPTHVQTATTISSEENSEVVDPQSLPKDSEDITKNDAKRQSNEKIYSLKPEDEGKEIISADSWMLDGGAGPDSPIDLQSIIRSIVVGLKAVIWGIINYRQLKEKETPHDVATKEDNTPSIPRVTTFEREILEKYIENVFPCIEIFSLEIDSKPQQGDVLTYFAASFAALDGFNLRCTMGKKIDILVENIIKDPNVMVIPRHLLGSKRSSSLVCCDILLKYLSRNLESLMAPKSLGFVFLSQDSIGYDRKECEHIKHIGKERLQETETMSLKEREKREKVASTYLELFERVMKSVTSFTDNELALRPYLQDIVSSSLRLSMEKGGDWPDNYCLLLRCIFRSLSAGKFEGSYKELLPMIPNILNGLNRIYEATDDESLRRVLVELCLTIPARLSSLLPHMPLLLRMIIYSLNTNKDNLVNLGLRTLEFWIDNLNPEFLYPILAKQTRTCTELMEALTGHLRPAPYPYGLLAMRVLGKLGGKNRRFLRECIPLTKSSSQSILSDLLIRCQWLLDDPLQQQEFLSRRYRNPEKPLTQIHPKGAISIPLPVSSAVKVLKMAALIETSKFSIEAEKKSKNEFERTTKQVSREKPDALWSASPDSIDLVTYCQNLVEDTASSQASDALRIICSALHIIFDLGELPPDLSALQVVANHSHYDLSIDSSTNSFAAFEKRTECFKSIIKGLLYALKVEKVENEARMCLTGLFYYVYGLLHSWSDSILRIDANGSRVPMFDRIPNRVGFAPVATNDQTKAPESSSANNNLGSLKPFGYFDLTGPFRRINPLILTEALAEIISVQSLAMQAIAVEFLRQVIMETVNMVETSPSINTVRHMSTGQIAFYESLLEALCRQIVTTSWNISQGLRDSISLLINVLGLAWAKKYEVELIHVAITCLKNAPREVPCASVDAFRFFTNISVSLYGKPTSWKSNDFIPDLSTMRTSEDTPIEDTSNAGDDQKKSGLLLPSDSVINMLLIELASTKQIVRIAARCALRNHFFDKVTLAEGEKRISSHMSTIKRVLFTRSLRLLPLPEQVAVIEALTALVDFVPGMLPVSDQHLLAFLSEFLKLSSIADGEMSDANIVGFVVDKNGFCGRSKSPTYPNASKHMSRIFLRRVCIARLCEDSYVVIPEEACHGIQLRVSALRLFNTVISRHSDGFFDADPTTPIGNIRPHVISLLFRSLVSEPPMSVSAAHQALQDVLSLSVVTKEDGEGTSKSQSRLPKELLQTCIRPVLLNLRDYTRLSVSLLRGLERLLSLLSSWFNKTLGEKLLEHLQKWTEPDLIKACNIWKEGDEPIVAAGILNLFSLLPHASHFVEPLVKTVIKLEAVLNRFKGYEQGSPYRKPLARYLNKQSQYTVSFFFQRLRTPMYSELFQHIVALEESETLRSYLSGRQCSVNLLNVCFERPLAIIRSEKTSASKMSSKQSKGASASVAEIMSIHGIAVGAGRQREALLRHDIDSKQKKLVILQQEATRTKETLQGLLTNATEGKDKIDDAKKRHKAAQAAFEKCKKDLNEKKLMYAAELGQPESTEAASNTKKMTGDALELQYQGFKLVETLAKFKKKYLPEHNDIVRAFRWLWRSKGRHLRLQNEEAMPLRFQSESKLLGSLLVEYATTCPSDVDVLFELLRIFLQATSRDFGFIRVFLADTVSNALPMNKKKHIIERFFALLAGEGPEETKVLSIQLIVLPMLLNTLKPTKDFSHSPSGGGFTEVRETLAEKSSSESLVDESIIKNFVQNVLSKSGITATYGERLRVELLRVSTLFIQCSPGLMAKHKDDVIKFSWALLKSENTSCKNWAFLNVCQYIATFDTPTNLLIQTYISLIRLHQLEGKGCIRSALSILLPCLKSKLDEQEWRNLIESTVGIVCKEGNNIPQVAHIWQTIVAHPNIFNEYRSYFMGHMVNSVARIGLSPSCPIEHRSLSLSVAELVLEWHFLHPTDDVNVGVSETLGDREKKRLKAEDGNAVPIGIVSHHLDKDMFNTICNFLVRMEILLADTKLEASTKMLHEKTLHLLRLLLRTRQSCVILPLYFEKVISMYAEETPTNKSSSWDTKENRIGEKSTQRAVSKPSSSKTRDDSKPVSPALLLACLEIFTILVVEAPRNSFMVDNAQVVMDILEPCFDRIRQIDSIKIRKKLKDFVIELIKSKFGDTDYAGVVQHIKVLLESLLDVDVLDGATGSWAESLSGKDSVRREDRRSKEQLESSTESENPCRSYIIFFSLDIIMEISTIYPHFVRSFSGTLVALVDKLVERHLQGITSLQPQGGVSSLAGRVSSQQHKQATSTCGILQEAYNVCKKPTDIQKVGETVHVGAGWLQVSDISIAIRSVIKCLQLISMSDIPFHFTQTRSSFMKILGSILDNSDNIFLLLSVTGIVGNWLALTDGRTPLAYKEKVAFLRKISVLDCRPLSAIVAQLLGDLVGNIMISIANQGISKVFPENDQPIKGTPKIELKAERSLHCFETPQKMFRRLLVSCLLNANRLVRKRALLLLVTKADKLNDALNLARSGERKVVLSGRNLFDVLLQLLSNDYEGVSARFWPMIFVEVLAYGCLPTSRVPLKRAWMPRPHAPSWDGSKDSLVQKAVNSFFTYIRSYNMNIHSRKQLILLEVVSLAHSDTYLMQRLFELFMTAAWNELGDDLSRSRLIQPIEKLLSRPYHTQRFSDTSGVTNSVQSFLRASRQMVPQPVLSPDLLLCLAETYRSWHEVISLLEHMSKAFASDGSNNDFSCKIASAIHYCVEKLEEKNIALFYSQERSLQPETKYAISLDVHDMVKEAISGYTKLVDIAENSSDEDSLKATDSEMNTWEDRWVHLQKEMCQLQVVSDYANATEDCLLQIETAWKNQDWEKVENLVKSESMIAMCERGDSTLKMNEILLAIMKGKLTEVENLHAQTAQLCLEKWQLMPDIATGSNCHSALLHYFHRLVEIRESGQIMVETMNHSNRRTLPDLQNLLSAWRHRLPNNFDKLSDWDDIITWRSHMFGSITSNFQWTSEAGTLSTLHDRPWTVIRMAKTARKQGLREVATLALSRITDCSLDVSDAFSKLREQILTFYNPDSDLERTGGLNLVNTTNLSFFDASQKSELFRLKASFLSSLGGRSKANQAYCHAVQVCQSYARAWVSWGGLCSSLGRLAEKQQNEQQKADSSEKESPNAKKVAQYLAQAMGCYLEAIQCDTDEWCRIHLPKCLWMLAKDGASPGVLSQTLETRGAALPCWVFLPWIPQLLTSLYRIEGKAVKAILTALAKTYPQALYFPLRAFYLERRDVERSKGSPSSGAHQGSVLYSEELMSSLRRAHASLWSSLEAILEELIVKFRPSYEEELLSTMTALLDRAETQIENSLHLLNDNIDDEEAVVASISKTLGRISTKFFRESETETNPIKRDERARKTETFKKKYKAMFEVDFLSLTTKAEGKPKIGIIDFLARLRKWKKMLNTCVSSSPNELPLIESSLPLALFVTEAPDLWPMSCDPRAASLLFESERTKEEQAGLSSTSSSALAAKTAAITAATAVANSEANEGCGGEYGGGSSSIEIPGQYAPNTVSTVDCKPSPELHAKLVRFEPRVKIIRRNDQLIRRVGMIGSDGRCYQFLLQFAIPYWTRTDERTVQLCYIFDKILRKDIICSRNFLSKQPSPVIPIAQRLRMTYEDKSRLSLDEVFKKRCEDVGCSPSIVVRYYQSRIRKVVDAQKAENMSEEERKKLVASANVQVLKEITTTKVDCAILLNHIKDRLGSAEALFHFRRSFSSQLAMDSLMQHVFSAVVRNPPRVVINELTGQVLTPEFRLSYNNQGFLENQNVPFRMTPNLKELIGPIMMGGRFLPSVSMAATSFKSNMEDMDAILRLLVRDDIVAWYTSKSMAKSDQKTQELEKQLMDRVSKNVAMIQSKITECSVKKIPKEVDKLPSEPINQRVQELLEEASSYEKLSTMETSFHPWL